MDTKGRLVKSLIAVSAAMILLLAVFAFPASAFTFDYDLIPPCPYFVVSGQLPYGEDTVVLYFETSTNMYWWFLNSTVVDSQTGASKLFTCYAEQDGSYINFVMGSGSEIVSVWKNKTTGSSNYETVGSAINGLYSWTYQEEFRNVSNVMCNYTGTYYGMDVYTAYMNGELTFNDELYEFQVKEYPSTELEAIDSVYNVVQDTFSKLDDIENQLQDIQGSSDEVITVVQEGNSEVKQEVQEQATNIVNDINNAGEDEESLDTDLSWMDSTIDTLQGWADTIDGFADTIESAGDEIEEYIESGSGIVSKFLDIVPGPVLAALAFGLVFIVVKKIVGREG